MGHPVVRIPVKSVERPVWDCPEIQVYCLLPSMDRRVSTVTSPKKAVVPSRYRVIVCEWTDPLTDRYSSPFQLCVDI